jgi:hypothetical protein
LLDATERIPELRAVVERARPSTEWSGVWLLEATPDELDQMYDLVQALMGTARSRKRQDILDGLLGSLCTSIDGF